MKLSEKQKAMLYLDLCEEMTGKKRKTIVTEFIRNRLEPSRIEDIEIYLRDRIEWLVEKKERVETPKITNAQKIMAEIMKKTKDAGKIVPTQRMIPWVYTPPTDKFGFYED